MFRWFARANLPQVVTAVALLSVAAAGCGHADPSASAKAAARPLEPKRVAVAVAELAPWPESVRVQGSLLAYEDATVGSKIAGRVESVGVDLGSVVTRGQPLVVLDRTELALRIRLAQSQLEQACAAIALTPEDDETKLEIENAAPVMLEKAMIDEAQSALDRAKPLISSRAITGAQVDTLVAQLRAAQARFNSARNTVREQIALIGVRRTELALARQQLADAEIVAPFDGVVDQRLVSPGEYVQIGQPVVTLVRSDRLRFTAGVPETKAGDIRIGQHVELMVAGIDEAPSATVSRVSPIVTQASRSLRIEADVPNESGQLQAGLFAEAEIIVKPDAQALSVPASAVSRFAGVQKVWRVADGKAAQVTVRVGRQEDDRAEILEGLRPGDRVIANADTGRDGPVIVEGAAAPADSPPPFEDT